jgi:hypothetical protein
MRPVLAALACLACAPAARPPAAPAVASTPAPPTTVPAPAGAFTFTGEILDGPRLPVADDAGRKAWAVGADPRFVLVLRIEEASAEAPFAAGTVQTFFIHSPARLFRGDAATVTGSFRFRGQLGAGRIVVLELD